LPQEAGAGGIAGAVLVVGAAEDGEDAAEEGDIALVTVAGEKGGSRRFRRRLTLSCGGGSGAAGRGAHRQADGDNRDRTGGSKGARMADFVRQMGQ
jgi:hypothetical protein